MNPVEQDDINCLQVIVANLICIRTRSYSWGEGVREGLFFKSHFKETFRDTCMGFCKPLIQATQRLPSWGKPSTMHSLLVLCSFLPQPAPCSLLQSWIPQCAAVPTSFNPAHGPDMPSPSRSRLHLHTFLKLSKFTNAPSSWSVPSQYPSPV